MTPLLEARGVTKRLGGRDVIRDVDLEVRPGEVLGLFGPGGHGKSVLLKLLAGLLRPDRGIVSAGGVDLAHLSGRELAAVRQDFGYVFQNYALFDFMTVGDNVAFPLRQMGLPEDVVLERARRRLEVVGLGHALDLYPRELSGGMKKRVGLARATVSDPRIVLYDDPTAGLDPVTSSKIFRLISDVHPRDRGGASVVVSHDIDRMKVVCDRYAMVQDGRIAFAGTEDELAAADPPVSRFFYGALEAKTRPVG